MLWWRRFKSGKPRASVTVRYLFVQVSDITEVSECSENSMCHFPGSGVLGKKPQRTTLQCAAAVGVSSSEVR